MPGTITAAHLAAAAPEPVDPMVVDVQRGGVTDGD